jgi:beta-glucosidase
MTNIHAGVLALFVSIALTASGAEERKPRSRVPGVLDATHPIEERVADLLGRMTFEEKVGQLRVGWPGVTAYEQADGDVEIADAWKPLLTDAPIGLLGSTLRAKPWLGVTRETGLSRREGAMFLNKVQRYVRDHTRLGIPLFVTDDAHRGQQAIGATISPQLCSMGPTWNPDLQESVARAIALEMRSQGVTIAFAPNLDVIRGPRWGRSDQNFAEDPWLAAEMGKAAVRGFQGESLNTDHSVVALLRAYPGLGDADGGHDFTGFSRGMRDLHEVVLRPWLEAICAGAEGVMIEQSEMDGIPVPCSHYYLDELASVARPSLQLKGFQRVHLQPGETKTVAFDIGHDELCFYGLDHKWIVEPGDFTIMIGRSSRDIALRGKLTVTEP